MKKMANIIQNKETFCKCSEQSSNLTTEQRNLPGMRSVSPRGHFFASRIRGSKKSLNYDRRLRDHKNIVEEN